MCISTEAALCDFLQKLVLKNEAWGPTVTRGLHTAEGGRFVWPGFSQVAQRNPEVPVTQQGRFIIGVSCWF